MRYTVGMATPLQYRDRLQQLKRQFEELKTAKEKLLKLVEQSEIAESVYNSNAIENSTLTLKETEKILLQMEIGRNLDVREVYEAKNLARVMEYIRAKAKHEELSLKLILQLHQMLIGGIDDSIAGRLRKVKEYVRVGSHIAPAPEHIEQLLKQALLDYSSDQQSFFADKIARFHLEFERIHPFNDGNGRIGRVLINYQLIQLGFPSVIIRNKGKSDYYGGFLDYQSTKDTKRMERLVVLALIESLHRRITYLRGQNIVKLKDYAKQTGKSINSLLNAARRQTLPAFREKASWMIGEPK